MCGIAAIFSYSSTASPVDAEQLLRIRDAMIHRGPDGSGWWISADMRAGLAHRRLAIIDLSETGAQPMSTADGRLRISFNGEIYNYREIRRELEGKGFRFRSSSDTEVLLHLYADRGAAMLDVLRGMYAFALWDDQKRGLFLARDPFGIKPLYYSDDGGTLRVASQVKALLKGGAVDTSPEPAGHVGYFLWGHVPEPYTLYRGIRALPAGTSLWIDSTGKREIRQFFSVTDELAKASETKHSLGSEEIGERLRTSLLDSVRHHMIADVPVGIFLSAGIDSSTITALASEAATADLRSVTLGFREFQGTDNDESVLAELVAQHYGTLHQTQWVTKDDFRSEYDRILDAMDQPSIDGVNSYFISRAAAQTGLKVTLSGLGGDELFGGYPAFREIPTAVKLVGPFRKLPSLGRCLRYVSAPILKRFTSPKYAGLLEYGGTYGGAYLLRRGMFMPWELPKLLDGELVRAGWTELQTLSRLEQTTKDIGNPHLRVEALETSWYMRNQLLRDTDWASMAHSLEIRLPLVDIELFRAAAQLFNSNSVPGKRAMAAAPFKALPRAVVDRKKTGFTTPVADWLVPSDRRSKAPRGLRVWATTIYRKWEGGRSGDSGEERPIALIFRTGQLGDTLVALPAIEYLRRRYPKHRFILLTDRHPAETGYVSSWDVCKATGWFDRVMFYNPNADGLAALQSRASLLIELRGMKIDQLFNLAPGRTDRQAARDKWFFDRMVRPRVYHPPATLRSPKPGTGLPLPRVAPEWRHTLRGVGALDSEDLAFRLSVPDVERQIALRAARADGIDFGAPLLAIGPGSKMPAKIWPVERFVELGIRIRTAFPKLQLVVLGGPEATGIGGALCDQWGDRSHNLAGKLSLYGSAAVLQRCTAYIGNDSGTMHLAAMTGIPCVAIFSARDSPGRWDPYGNSHIVLRHEVECAGCLLDVCAKYDNKCLRFVGVDDVFRAMKAVVAELTLADGFALQRALLEQITTSAHVAPG
jgi:asparagine synthase (glutamine-hydrolysing)